MSQYPFLTTADTIKFENELKQEIASHLDEYYPELNLKFIDAELIHLEHYIPGIGRDRNLNWHQSPFGWIAAVVVEATDGLRYGFGLNGHICDDMTLNIRTELHERTFAPRTDGVVISQQLRNKLTEDTAEYWTDFWDLQDAA